MLKYFRGANFINWNESSNWVHVLKDQVTEESWIERDFVIINLIIINRLLPYIPILGTSDFS